jgi:hypothetical protein
LNSNAELLKDVIAFEPSFYLLKRVQILLMDCNETALSQAGVRCNPVKTSRNTVATSVSYAVSKSGLTAAKLNPESAAMTRRLATDMFKPIARTSM